MSSEMLLLFLSMIYSFIDRCDYSLCLYGSEIRLEPVLLLFFVLLSFSYIIQYNTIHLIPTYYTIQFHIKLYHTIPYYTIPYYTIPYYIILYYTILYCTVLYYTILYYTILHYTSLHYTILHYTIL